MKFKQLTIIITGILLAVILSACGENVSYIEEGNRETAKNEALQTAEEFLTLLGGGEFEQAESLLSDSSISEWTAKDFEDLFAPSSEIYGELSGINLMKEEEDTYPSTFNFVYEGKFGMRTALFFIGLNENNEVYNFQTDMDANLQFSERIHEAAGAFLDFASEGEFEEAADLLEDGMEPEITPAEIASEWNNLEEVYGEFTHFNLYEEQTFYRDSSLILVAEFGEQPVLFNVYINEENAITGYYFRSYDEEEDFIYPEEAHQTAEAFLTHIVEEDFEEAATLLDDELEFENPPEGLEKWRTNVEQEYGEWIDFDLNHEEDAYGPPSGNYAFVYDVEFMEQLAAITIYVNRENEITGYQYTDFEREE